MMQLFLYLCCHVKEKSHLCEDPEHLLLVLPAGVPPSLHGHLVLTLLLQFPLKETGLDLTNGE